MRDSKNNACSVIVLMGVAGSGKTTIGKILAKELKCKFYDADDHHAKSSIDIMRAGIALNDDDRIPWLKKLSGIVTNAIKAREKIILAFSGLKEDYRKIVFGSHDCICLIHLHGEYDIIYNRLILRKHHFFDPSLLSSQFSILEEPTNAMRVEVNGTPAEITREIIDFLNRPKGRSS